MSWLVKAMYNRKLLIGILFAILTISVLSQSFAIQPVNASTTILADTINSTINNVNWNLGDSWTSNWAIILANQDNLAFDRAISQDVTSGNYIDAIYVARLAQLSGYSSDVIIQNLQLALQGAAMCGSLPITVNAHSYGDPDILNQGTYNVYHRFTLWGYQYAQEYGLQNKWNTNQAFLDFSKAYDKKPTGSVSGEMLWCDPQENWAKSYSSRYYDEHAQTLGVFLKFAEQNVPNALSYADKAWAGIQAHWNSMYGYYGYTGTTVVECEMGNFAQLIAEYKDQSGGTIPYWDRVISDLNYKLLAQKWTSPGWASPGVIIHAKGVNNQLRLWETMGATIALQNQYPYFSSTMKSNWQNMLMGSQPAWQGLIASNLNSGGYFRGVSGEATSNDATVCGAATLFLDGVVPVTGSLKIPNREELCNDQRTPFMTSEFKFDYTNHMIKIPVRAGQITFIYGSSPISYTFPTDGVYDIQFSNDWNLITAVNGQQVITNPPSQPLNLQATAGNNQVTLTWTAPSSDGGAPITSYTIYRATTTDQYIQIATVSNTATNYLDLTVTSGQTYYYTITASNAAGESDNSNVATATPTAPKTINLAVTTDKQSYSRGTSVTITVTSKDTASTLPINGAATTTSIYGPNGRSVFSSTSNTDANGVSTFIYKVPLSAQRGTYTIKTTATAQGYLSASAQATFNVK
jgi:hypothetical protein